MTFTYVPPASNGTFAQPRDEVRLLIGDTVQRPTSLQDEEIAYFVAATAPGGVPQPKQAAALAARQLADRYEVQAASQVKVGPFSVERDYAAIAEQLRARAEDLEGGGATRVIVPIVPTPASVGTVFRLGMTSPDTFYADDDPWSPPRSIASPPASGAPDIYEGGTYT